MKTVIYRMSNCDLLLDPAEQDPRFRYVLWKPSIQRFVPPGKNRKYFFYWLFHCLQIFRNRDYAALLVYDGEKLVSSLLVVPAHFKWPFMRKNDVQFIYVLTHPEYRGKGLAETAILLALRKVGAQDRYFWYVTDAKNIASINLCTKVGFEFYSDAERTLIFRVLKADHLQKSTQK